jgi:hypothetical protein
MTIRKQGSSRMMKGLLTFTAFSLVASASASAAAQDPPAASSSCPPGSWFCADAQQPSQGVQPGQPLQPLPSPEGATQALPAPPTPTTQTQPPPTPPPPVVVYQPAPPIMVVQPRHEIPPRYDYTPRSPAWQRPREWGLNLHLAGAMLGKRAAAQASMGGFGLGLRYKPSPGFGLEAVLDRFNGRDYQGYTRDETAFSLNALLFVNPRSRLQVYFVGGVNWSSADVKLNERYFDRAEYSYFGAHGGIGLELRAAKHFAFNLDMRGFVRGRTDDAARYTPEFREQTNGVSRATNTSGGGLMTAGMTFYF